jgi:hypothetical protein
MADVLSEVMGAVVGRLEANTTLIGLGVAGWHDTFAPANTPTPFGLISFLSGGDTNTSFSRDVRLRLLIIGVGSTPAQARAMCDALDAELHGTELSISGWSNYRCLADDDYAMPDHYEGKRVYKRGKVFGIWLDK